MKPRKKKKKPLIALIVRFDQNHNLQRPCRSSLVITEGGDWADKEGIKIGRPRGSPHPELLLSVRMASFPQTTRPLTPAELQDCIQRDQAIFPTAHPMTLDILLPLFRRHPNFALGYHTTEGSLAAVSLAIPLKETSWRNLIAGEIEESGLEAARDSFDPEVDLNLAIHWYHTEVLDKAVFPTGFYLRSLADLGHVVAEIRKEYQGLRIAGISALAVSKSGIGLFEGKLGFREQKWVSQEYVVKDEDGICALVTAESEEEAREKSQGRIVQNRIKMLVLERGQQSVVWDHVN